MVMLVSMARLDERDLEFSVLLVESKLVLTPKPKPSRLKDALTLMFMCSVLMMVVDCEKRFVYVTVRLCGESVSFASGIVVTWLVETSGSERFWIKTGSRGR